MKTKGKILLKKMLKAVLVLTLGVSLSSITHGNEIGYYDMKGADRVKSINTDLRNTAITENPYVKYEEEMRAYGFDKMYDNQSAKSDEPVTKAEALKLVLSVALNTDQLEGYSEKEEEYPNAAWVNYAKTIGVTKEDINITNYKDPATYSEAIAYFEAFRLLFEKDLLIESAEQEAVEDRAANGEDYLFKGQLNELAVKYVRHYHKENGGIIKALEVRLNKTSVYPGDSFSIFISNTDVAENFSVSAPFYNKPIRCYKQENGFVGLIPVEAWSVPGKYQIQVTDTRTKGLTTLDVKILPKTFDVQYLKVSKSTAAIATTSNSDKDQVYFDGARANPIQEKLWKGAFVQPAKGRITTDYCATRYTNDNPTPSRHLAIDIANTTGTPIVASNNGKVVLAKKLIVTGNTIVIDHGWGVFTSYFHLNKISVKEKDFVTKGNVIGKMGSTGYSTGPHLHFAIWKDGTFLNPWTFFEKDPMEF